MIEQPGQRAHDQDQGQDAEGQNERCVLVACLERCRRAGQIAEDEARAGIACGLQRLDASGNRLEQGLGPGHVEKEDGESELEDEAQEHNSDGLTGAEGRAVFRHRPGKQRNDDDAKRALQRQSRTFHRKTPLPAPVKRVFHASGGPCQNLSLLISQHA